jgi:hypothetical protein
MRSIASSAIPPPMSAIVKRPESLFQIAYTKTTGIATTKATALRVKIARKIR